MTKSQKHRNKKSMGREVYTADWEDGAKYCFSGIGFHTTDAPPYKVGKQFPYENHRRLQEARVIRTATEGAESAADIPDIAEEAVRVLHAPRVKSPEQMQIEATWLGKNRHNLPKKKATHKRGHSQVYKSYRDTNLQRDGHSVVPIEIES